MLKTTAIGHLGKDAIVKQVENKTVISFSVAHTEKWKSANGVVSEKTTWLSCSYWTDKTGIAPYLTKGTQIYIEGTPDSGHWTNRQGETTSFIKIRVTNIQLLGGKREGDGSPHNTNRPANSPAGNTSDRYMQGSASDISEPIDDLPF